MAVLVQALGNRGKPSLALSIEDFASNFDIHEYLILSDVHALLMPDAESVEAWLQQLDIHGPGESEAMHKVRRLPQPPARPAYPFETATCMFAQQSSLD